MGPWHVIAHVPYFGERGHVASRDEYTLRTDGRIGVRYVYQEGFGEPVETIDSKATVKADSGNRRWTTWFFGVIPTKFRILEIAPDYSWALIDYPGGDLAWIFARGRSGRRRPTSYCSTSCTDTASTATRSGASRRQTFARSADIDDSAYAGLVGRMRSHGVDTGKLVRVPQRVEQVGKPGFAAPKKP